MKRFVWAVIIIGQLLLSLAALQPPREFSESLRRCTTQRNPRSCPYLRTGQYFSETNIFSWLLNWRDALARTTAGDISSGTVRFSRSPEERVVLEERRMKKGDWRTEGGLTFVWYLVDRGEQWSLFKYTWILWHQAKSFRKVESLFLVEFCRAYLYYLKKEKKWTFIRSISDCKN